MYEIYADNQLIYSDVTPLDEVKVLNPKLTLADSAAGQLDMTLPPNNVGYSLINRMVTDITVKENGEWLWSGRVLQDSFDFWNNRKMVCEGELAFLNDSIQPPAKYDVSNDHTTIYTFLEALINIHNSQVGSNRRFVLGMVTVNDGDQQDDNDSIMRYTNYESTLECINDKLLSRLGGHLRIRHVNGQRLLDYITDGDLGTNSQIVRFGVNLLDFSKNIDMSELATAIVPRGARLEDEKAVEVEGLEPYLTVKSLGTKYETITVDGQQVTRIWHDSGQIYVKNPVAIDNFGWVCAVVDWDAVTDATNLYNKAVRYLKDEQYEKMTLEIKAVDLKYMNYDEQSIRFLTKLRCISEPHGMDHTFLVSKMEIDLSDPGNSLFTLGSDLNLSLTQRANKANADVQIALESIPSRSSILEAAKKNAYNILLAGDGSDGGYVRFEVYKPGEAGYNANFPDRIKSIVISDGPNDDTSLRKWVWNVNGLGHMRRNSYQAAWGVDKYSTLDVAMTMDGKIVANAITLGTLIANNGVFELNMSTGQVTMKNGDFKGTVTATSGKIAGFEIDGKDLKVGDAVLSRYYMGAGNAGYGIVNICGNNKDGSSDGRYGYIMIANSGDPVTARDGIKIYGNGHIRWFDTNGNEWRDRYLGNIPES